MCIGSGGVLGTGLGQGVANRAGHLPERESDSIFAVIAEEGGFLGASGFLLLYLVFFTPAAPGRRAHARALLAAGGGGVALYFASHFFINIGVNLGLLPMTGLTLPMISTGGSSLLASFLALAWRWGSPRATSPRWTATPSGP